VGTEGLYYKEFLQKLKKRYDSHGMEEQYQMELRCRRRKKGGFIRELAQDVRRLPFDKVALCADFLETRINSISSVNVKYRTLFTSPRINLSLVVKRLSS